uniref:Putative secreted protein n=1 Tax=Anopheles marajoara TaxID=58244 RepID=A0A2M4C8M9_9DIPT
MIIIIIIIIGSGRFVCSDGVPIFSRSPSNNSSSSFTLVDLSASRALARTFQRFSNLLHDRGCMVCASAFDGGSVLYRFSVFVASMFLSLRCMMIVRSSVSI